MPRGKGSPRCEKCEGRGLVRVPHGMLPCECVRGKPNYAVLARLAAYELPDFATYDDELRRRRGEPPFQLPQGVSNE